MNYKLIHRPNPKDRSKGKYYAIPINQGRVKHADILKEIVNSSSVSRGNAANVMESLLEIVAKHLFEGKSVSIGEFGTFRVSFSSHGIDHPALFSKKMINGMKVVFTMSVDMKKQLKAMPLEEGEG